LVAMSSAVETPVVEATVVEQQPAVAAPETAKEDQQEGDVAEGAADVDMTVVEQPAVAAPETAKEDQQEGDASEGAVDTQPAVEEDSQNSQAQEANSGEPQKPKKPTSAYMLFAGAVRDEVIKEAEAKNGVKPKMGETAKLIANKWKEVSEEEKASWQEKVASAKERYEADLKAYQEHLDPVGTLRAKIEHLIPVKPLSFYGLFLEDPAKRGKAHGLLIAEGKQATKPNVMAKMGQLWRALTEEQKAPFIEKAKQLQADYEQKMQVWEALPECAELGRVTKEQEDREEAAKREREAQERQRLAERTAKRDAKKEERDAKKETTPTKRATAAGTESSPPDAKKPRTEKAVGKATEKAVGKAKKSQEPAIDEDILLQATKLGWEGQLRNLALRPEVIASGKTAGEILESLRGANGLVNAAKRSLLGC